MILSSDYKTPYEESVAASTSTLALKHLETSHSKTFVNESLDEDATLSFCDPLDAAQILASLEAEWFETLQELQANIDDLNAERNKRHQNLRSVQALEQLVYLGMRRLARIHPDPRVKAEWNTRADEFSSSIHPDCETTFKSKEKNNEISRGGLKGRATRLIAKVEDDSALVSLSKGVGMVMISPVVMASAPALAAGAIVMYGSAKLYFGVRRIIKKRRMI